MLAAITSQIDADGPLTIGEVACVDGVLPKKSLVKPGKLFTVHTTLVLKRVCSLRQAKLDVVLAELRQFFS